MYRVARHRGDLFSKLVKTETIPIYSNLQDCYYAFSSSGMDLTSVVHGNPVGFVEL